MNMPLEAVLKLETRLPLNLVEIYPGLEEDIRQHGIKEPIEIKIREDGSLIVWDGLHRLVIAVRLELEYVPMIMVPM